MSFSSLSNSFNEGKTEVSSQDKIKSKSFNYSYSSEDTIDNDFDHLDVYNCNRENTNESNDTIDFNFNEHKFIRINTISNESLNKKVDNDTSIINIDELLIKTFPNKENFEVLETLSDFQIDNFFIKLIPLPLEKSFNKSQYDTEYDDSIFVKVYMDGEFQKSILIKSSDAEQINFSIFNSERKIIFLSGSWFFLK